MRFTDWLLTLLHTIYSVEDSKATAPVVTTYKPEATKRVYKSRKRKPTATEVVDAITVK